MITERHTVACRLIMKAISKGSLVACLVHMDARSTNRLAQHKLQIPEHANKRTLPSWLFDARLSARDRLTFSRPDAILGLLRNSNHHWWLATLPVVNHSSVAPGDTPKTTQWRCTQRPQAQYQ